MAKYLVEGFLPIKMEVEADSEDEALEMAEESFSFTKDVDEESLPKWEAANLLGGNDEDEDESYTLSTRRSHYDNEDDDDN